MEIRSDRLARAPCSPKVTLLGASNLVHFSVDYSIRRATFGPVTMSMHDDDEWCVVLPGIGKIVHHSCLPEKKEEEVAKGTTRKGKKRRMKKGGCSLNE